MLLRPTFPLWHVSKGKVMVVPFKVGRECVKMSPTPSVATRGAKSLATSVQQGRTKFVSLAHSRAALGAPVDNNVTPG